MYVPLHHVNSVYVKLNFRLVDRTPRWSRYCCIYALRAALLWPNNAHCLRTRIYQTYQTDQLVSILVQCAAFSCQSVIKQNAIRNKQALFSDAL